MMILDAQELTVRRGGTTIFSQLSLAVNAGELCAVVGGNGTGKSTLLAALAGVLPIAAGTVTVCGLPVHGRNASAARQRIGYVPEGVGPPPQLRGAELWALVASTKAAALPSATLTEQLGLAALADRRLGEMSLGQRRRTLIAAALIGAPQLLLLDEPDNGLDAAGLAALVALVNEHLAQGGAAIIASHDVSLLDAWPSAIRRTLG